MRHTPLKVEYTLHNPTLHAFPDKFTNASLGLAKPIGKNDASLSIFLIVDAKNLPYPESVSATNAGQEKP
jgi:hypothetical protein